MYKTFIFILSPSEFHSTSPAVSYPRLPRDGCQCPQTISYSSHLFLLKPWLRGAHFSLEEARDGHPILSNHHAVNKFCVPVQIAAFKQVFGGKRGHVLLRKSLIEKEEPRFQNHLTVNLSGETLDRLTNLLDFCTYNKEIKMLTLRIVVEGKRGIKQKPPACSK